METLLWVLQGLVYEDRPEGGLSPQKLEFARSAEEGRKHAGAEDFDIAGIRPTALIGASARRGTFSEAVIRALVKVRIDCSHELALSSLGSMPVRPCTAA